MFSIFGSASHLFYSKSICNYPEHIRQDKSQFGLSLTFTEETIFRIAFEANVYQA